MWKRIWNKKRQAKKKKSGTSLIAWSLLIQGEVKFEGTLHVEGQITGNISSDQGVLTLSQGGCVEGDICVSSIRINGMVKGNVYCSKHLVLSEKAIITGNVYYNAIEMAKGAEVNGNLEHLDSTLFQQSGGEPSEDKSRAPTRNKKQDTRVN